MNEKIEKNAKILKILYVMASILFITPSICYFYKYKTVLKFDKYFTFLLNDSAPIIQTITYLIIITSLIIIYYLIVKNRKKMFKNIKSVIGFIAIISLIFVFTLPITSGDVFYYLGVGRLNSQYMQNPYYVTIDDYVKGNKDIDLNADTTLAAEYDNYWGNTTVVYGPIWTIICSIVGKLSFGNVNLGLFIFKILSLMVHILNCYLIYKLSKKKIFVLLYGLNPFILIEGIVNVHNDIFMILFILTAFYFLLKRKELIISLFFLAMGTCIKYFTIILLPFFIIYYFRKENPGKRIIKCITYGMLFIVFVVLPYLIYIRDISVLSGISEQYTRLSKSLYLILYVLDEKNICVNIEILYIYILIFGIKNIIFLFNSKIKLKEEMKSNLYYIFVFLFIVLTNFQPWYIMWLIPFMIYQKASNIRLIIKTGLISMYSNAIFFMYGEKWIYGVWYYLSLVVCIVIVYLFDNRKKIINFVKRKNSKLQYSK